MALVTGVEHFAEKLFFAPVASIGEFKLTLDPGDKLIFTGNLSTEAATINIKITNPLKERVVFKVKCTSNELFRIRPPVGELNPGETAIVTLIFNQSNLVPENDKHYFEFYYLKEEKKAARPAWEEHKGKPEGIKRLFVDFKNEDGGEKKDEKKDEKEEKKEEKKDHKKEEKKDEKKKDKNDKTKEDKKDEKEGKKDDKKDRTKEENSDEKKKEAKKHEKKKDGKKEEKHDHKKDEKKHDMKDRTREEKDEKKKEDKKR